MFALYSQKKKKKTLNVAYFNCSKYVYQTSLINTESQSVLSSSSASLAFAKGHMLTDAQLGKIFLSISYAFGAGTFCIYIPLTEVGSWLILELDEIIIIGVIIVIVVITTAHQTHLTATC